MIENFIDNLEEKTGKEDIITKTRKGGLLIVCLFLIAVVFCATGCGGGLKPSTPEPLVGIEPPPDMASSEVGEIPDKPAKPEVQQDTSDVQTVDVVDSMPKSEKPSKSKKGKKEKEPEMTEVIELEDDLMVTMAVLDTGRPDPFQPAHEAAFDPDAAAKAAAAERMAKELQVQNAKLEFDLVDPPLGATPDSDAERVMTTKVSGIIYDEDSPSAILNIEGSDFLVRSGDIINGYKILAINKTLVTVQLGANIYKAGVGELLQTDGIIYNTISNLENKFGGSGR
ncbi:hypothetical protein J6A31_03590 [bacterium]|nr:hypothetical protein [bacterium]